MKNIIQALSKNDLLEKGILNPHERQSAYQKRWALLEDIRYIPSFLKDKEHRLEYQLAHAKAKRADNLLERLIQREIEHQQNRLDVAKAVALNMLEKSQNNIDMAVRKIRFSIFDIEAIQGKEMAACYSMAIGILKYCRNQANAFA